MSETITIIKRPVGRPRLSQEEKLQRLEKYREQNRITQQNLRREHPELCRQYRKKYYMEHNTEVKEKLSAMKTIFQMWKEGKLILSERPLGPV